MRNDREACLVCRHCEFSAPPDWKPDPDRYGDKEFNELRIAINHISKTQKHIEVNCSLNPVWVRVWSHHHCGAFSRRANNVWAGQYDTINELIHGSHLVQRNRELEKEVAKMKQQLAVVRRISAGRLARLQKPKSKPNAVTDRIPEEPAT